MPSRFDRRIAAGLIATGALIDKAMLSIETENPTLKGVLTKNYARPELNQTKLGELVNLFSNLAFRDEHHRQDVLGRVYEYFSRPVRYCGG